MTPREKYIYYHAQLDAFKKCRQHLVNNLKIIDFEVLSCEKELEVLKEAKPTEQTPDERLAFMEAANYQPEY